MTFKCSVKHILTYRLNGMTFLTNQMVHTIVNVNNKKYIRRCFKLSRISSVVSWSVMTYTRHICALNELR